MKKLLLILSMCSVLFALPGWSQEAADAAATVAAAAAPVQAAEKGDDAFLMMSSAFVILMSVPGLALFYGGLVRKKNMLSVLMQVFTVFSMITVLWVVYGYSVAFTEGNAYVGSLSKVMLHGVTADSLVATWSKGVFLHEFIITEHARIAKEEFARVVLSG